MNTINKPSGNWYDHTMMAWENLEEPIDEIEIHEDDNLLEDKE